MSDPSRQTDTPRVVLITGLSGSGKSIALEVLEDSGYYCIDNLPVSLFEALARDITTNPSKAQPFTAIGMDARSPGSELSDLPQVIKRLRDHGIDCEVVFLDAEDGVLMQRFSETRRRHPLTDREHPLEKAIALERETLEPLRELANLRFDTTRTTLHELRALVRSRVAARESGQTSVMLQSFGFKHGLPRNADFVFDVRCLPNPHWEPALRAHTGRDRPVVDYLEASREVADMLAGLEAFLLRWIPCFEAENRSYLTIAIGCTGGQHRSVYLVEQLSRLLAAHDRAVTVHHRELP
jgi:UPF0042 nucleotide-binding protein